jgi:hypothetical protein
MRAQTFAPGPFAAIALIAVACLPLAARAQASGSETPSSQAPAQLSPIKLAPIKLAPIKLAPIVPSLSTAAPAPPVPALKPPAQQTPDVPALAKPIPEPPAAVTPAPAAPMPVATAPAPTAPASSPDITKMAPIDLATAAVLNLEHADTLPGHYTFLKTEQVQEIIDDKLVADHTTGFESVFIGGLPYLRRISYDGNPLSDKDQKSEQRLYDKAVKDRTGLSEATRLALAKHASRDAVLNYNRVPFDFALKLDGHTTVDGIDCVVLDAMPLPTSLAPSQQLHLRLAIEPTDLQVLDIHKEFLAANNGFDKGTVVEARYELHEGNPLLAEQTLDTVVRFKELLDKPIHVHQVTRYTNYRRFRATVTIEAVHELPPDVPKVDPKAPPSSPPR